MNILIKKLLSQANDAYREKKYTEAKLIYQEALKFASDPIINQINFNINLTNKKIKDRCDKGKINKREFFQVKENHSFWDSSFYEWIDKPHGTATGQIYTNSHIKNLQDFGGAFIGPVFAKFFSEFFNKINNYNINKLWFLAREGYLLGSVFRRICKEVYPENKIEARYLLCSRTLLFRLSIFDKKLRQKTLEHNFAGTVESLFRNRFAFSEKEILKMIIISKIFRENVNLEIKIPRDVILINKIIEDIQCHFENEYYDKFIYYKNYLDALGFGMDKEEHVVDLGYSGTIQSLLTDLTHIPTQGHYFITTNKAINSIEKKFTGYLCQNTNFGAGNMLLDRSLFMESLLTAPHGQVIDINKNNNGEIYFSFGDITKSQIKFKEIEFIIDGAVKYAINAIKHDATMDVVELERYYASFINSPSAFPKSINEIFEVDDKISGFGIINPISFFGLKN